MVAKEYCCYTRPYSSIEGFQLAHTLYYSASVEEEGVVLAVRRYLCENGVGLGHWLDVLDDAGQVYWPCTAANGQQESGKPARFVAFAGFEGANLVHNPELTQSV